MTDTKQPEALRLSEWLDHHGERTTHSDAADELRRQHAEIEALQDDLAHKDDYAEQLGRELAKADSVIKELRAKLDELEEQEPYKYMGRSGTLFNERIPGIESKALYLAAGARPVEPVQKLRPDFIAGYDAGMADAKRIQAAQPAPAERTGCELGCTTECKAKAHGCASECPALPWQPKPAPGAGDQVQMILKHRLIRKVEGDWLAASEFMTGEPDPSWLAKTEESPEEWRIEQARRVSGEQIQAGLTRAFASWKKPAPAAVVGPNDGSTPGVWFVRTQERFGALRDCFVAAPDCQGLPYDAEILGDDEYRDGVARKLADCKLIVAAVNAYRAAPAERTGCELGCTTECKAKTHGCASECPALPWQPKPSPQQGEWKLVPVKCTHEMAVAAWGDVLNWREFAEQYSAAIAAAPTTQPAPAAQDNAKDAARYRWLRDPTTDVSLVLDKRTGYVPADEQVPGVGDYYTYEYRAGIELDAAIDSALAADKKEPT